MTERDWLVRRRDLLESSLESGSGGDYERWRWDCDRLAEVLDALAALDAAFTQPLRPVYATITDGLCTAVASRGRLWPVRSRRDR